MRFLFCTLCQGLGLDVEGQASGGVGGKRVISRSVGWFARCGSIAGPVGICAAHIGLAGREIVARHLAPTHRRVRRRGVLHTPVVMTEQVAGCWMVRFRCAVGRRDGRMQYAPTTWPGWRGCVICAGTFVTSHNRRTRWVTGKTFVWLSRRTSYGKVAASSGLAFDTLIRNKK